LLSSHARKKANEEIAEAKRQQNLVADISQEATDRSTLKTSMAKINSNRLAIAMQGGYD